MKNIKNITLIIAFLAIINSYGQKDFKVEYPISLSAKSPLEYTIKNGAENIKKKVDVVLKINNFTAHHSEIISFADGGLAGSFKCDIIFNTWFSYSKPSGFYVDGTFISFEELGIDGISFTVKEVSFQWIQGVYGSYNRFNMGSPTLPTNPKGDKPGYNGAVYLQLKEMVGDHGSCAKDIEVVKGRGPIFGYNLKVKEVVFTPPYELRKFLTEREQQEIDAENKYQSSITSTTKSSPKISSESKDNSSTTKKKKTTNTSWMDQLSNEQKIAYLKKEAADRIRQVEKNKRLEQERIAAEWKRKRQKEVADRERRSQRQYEGLMSNINSRKYQGKEQRLATYKSLGGEANYNAKYKDWKAFATSELKKINQYLVQFNGKSIPFQYPKTSCDFVTIIESINHSKMPLSYKDILIDNLLSVRNEFYKFDIENGYIENELDLNFDTLGRDNSTLPCSNYLEAIAGYKGFRQFGKFSKTYKFETGIDKVTTMGGSTYSELKLKTPFGMLPYVPKFHFTDFLNQKGIYIKSYHFDKDYIWDIFHRKPYNWSSGLMNFKFSFENYSLSRMLWDKPDAIKKEVDKQNLLFNSKRAYGLNTIDDEIRMAIFNYHTGNHQLALDHLLRYITLNYGDLKGFTNALKESGLKYDGSYNDYDARYSNKYVFPLLTAILLNEAGHFEESLVVLDALQVINSKNNNSYSNNRLAVTEAILKLTNQVYYRKGEFNKMKLPTSDQQISVEYKAINTIFKDPGVSKSELDYAKEQYYNFRDFPTRANALIKLGQTKLAKKIFTNAYKFYQKQGVYKGTKIDIEAFKEVATVLKLSTKTIQFREAQGYDVFYKKLTNPRLQGYNDQILSGIFLGTNELASYLPYFKEEVYYTKSGRQSARDLDVYPKNKNKEVVPTIYINTSTINLNSNVQWEDLVENIINLNWDSKDSLTQVFLQMKTLYQSGNLVANEETYLFLTNYIQIGVALGHFHDIVPVIAKKRLLFPSRELKVEDHLALYMWPHAYEIYDWDKNPNKKVLTALIKKSEIYSSGVKHYLTVWSNFKITSPKIPFLYSL